MGSSTTFGRQSQLPRLPVPRLENTLKLWRDHLIPVTAASDAGKVDAIIKEFGEGLAPTLHGRLKNLENELASKCNSQLINDLTLPTPAPGTPGEVSPYSWLEDIWYKYAYLYGRGPLPIAMNWWGLFRNHPERPELESKEYDHVLGFPRPANPKYRQGFTDWSAIGRREFSEFQLKRAAGFASNLTTYYERLVSGSVPPDGSDQNPQCMNQMRMIYGVTRVPTTMGYDVLRVPGSKEEPRYAILLIKGLAYRMSLYDEVSGKRWNLATLQKQMAMACEDALQVYRDKPAIGILTGMDRDVWGHARDRLRRLSPRNMTSIECIEGALFCVALEDFAVGSSTAKRGEIMACGLDGTNRWYDKCLTIVTLADGTAGCNVEHTPADAVNQCYPIMYALDHEPAHNAPSSLPDDINPGGAIPQRLDFDTDAELDRLLTDSTAKLRSMCNTVDYDVCEFRRFGLREMKRLKVSADVFVQMAMQLAYHRLHNRFGTTYETAGTRKFLHGRTETMRPLTKEATVWVESMSRPQTSPVEQRRLFEQVAKKHNWLMKNCSNGQGADRHLLGLKAMMQPGESTEFFSNPLSSPFGGVISQWRLSTSPLPPAFWRYFIGTGFGNLTQDVYGVNYMIAPHLLRFSIESHRESMHANTRLFHLELRATLRDMRNMCLRAMQQVSGTIIKNPKEKEEQGVGLPYPYVAKL